MVDAHSQMVRLGETSTVPLMALALTSTAGDSAYAPMDLVDYSDGDGLIPDEFQACIPPAPSYESHADDVERDIPKLKMGRIMRRTSRRTSGATGKWRFSALGGPRRNMIG